MNGPIPHILVVEDHQPNATLVCDVLSFHGFRVTWAPDGPTGLDLVRDDRPDLILMDIQMPGVDGLSLTRRLKGQEETRDIPIVALTARAMVDDVEEAMAAGFDGYLTKPIDTRELPHTIRRFLHRDT